MDNNKLERLESAIVNEDINFYDITGKKVQLYDVLSYCHEGAIYLIIVVKFVSNNSIRGIYLDNHTHSKPIDFYNTALFYLTPNSYFIVNEEIKANNELTVKYNNLIDEYKKIIAAVKKKPVDKHFFFVKFLNRDEMDNEINVKWQPTLYHRNFPIPTVENVKFIYKISTAEFEYTHTLESINNAWKSIKENYSDYYVLTDNGLRLVSEIDSVKKLKLFGNRAVSEFYYPIIFYIDEQHWRKIEYPSYAIKYLEEWCLWKNKFIQKEIEQRFNDNVPF